MQNTPATLVLPPLKAIALWQSLLVIVITALVWQGNIEIAKAWLYGSFVFIIPQSLFVRQSYKYTGAAKTQQVVAAMYKGQLIKVALTFLMFALIFRMVKIQLPGLLFVSYAINALFHFLVSVKILKQYNHLN